LYKNHLPAAISAIAKYAEVNKMVNQNQAIQWRKRLEVKKLLSVHLSLL
jgi:hypothetical protein